MRRICFPAAAMLVLIGCATQPMPQDESELEAGLRWLAGDHHVHSHFSVGWDQSVDPPAAIIGADAAHAIPETALMAKHFGLSWMVTTDHGGPNHSKVNLEQAYPELLRSRQVLPEVIQFYGMELNTPGGEHSSLIVPHTHDEAAVLFELESGFDNRDAHPHDPTRNTEERMIEALVAMRKLPAPPVIIANHPSRTARGDREYGAYTPAELRQWNDTAPDVAVGMAGAPGHQAAGLVRAARREDESTDADPAAGPAPPRGAYGGYPTLGGYDQMTAKVGGFWDSMLGEGRRWWITANSDFHRHYSTGRGIDFWPGEYSKTYVLADRNHDALLVSLRAGRMFVTTGDLINELELTVATGAESAGMGDELRVQRGSRVDVTIRVRDPNAKNAGGNNPRVARVDLIVGDIHGRNPDASSDRNETTRVVERFGPRDWRQEGEYLTMAATLDVDTAKYLRVRGTNTDQLEPELDPPGEDPWRDLWFYSNPVFISVE